MSKWGIGEQELKFFLCGLLLIFVINLPRLTIDQRNILDLTEEEYAATNDFIRQLYKMEFPDVKDDKYCIMVYYHLPLVDGFGPFLVFKAKESKLDKPLKFASICLDVKNYDTLIEDLKKIALNSEFRAKKRKRIKILECIVRIQAKENGKKNDIVTIIPLKVETS